MRLSRPRPSMGWVKWRHLTLGTIVNAVVGLDDHVPAPSALERAITGAASGGWDSETDRRARPAARLCEG